MIAIVVIGFAMILVSILFCYLEALPFIDSVKEDYQLIKGPVSASLYIFKVIGHIPKLFPCLADIGITLFLSGSLGFGNGLLGGITGLFASNIISIIIYYHTHIRNSK